MRLRLVAAGLAVVACASPGSRVQVEGYRGAYVTHFGGIPDRGRICAIVANRDTSTVGWLRLRLRALAPGPPGSRRRPAWQSHWLYRGPLAPGKSVVLELRDLPVARELELSVVETGRSGPARRGRRPQRVARCAETELIEALRLELADRTAEGIAILPMRPAAGSRLVADGRGAPAGSDPGAGSPLPPERPRPGVIASGRTAPPAPSTAAPGR